MLYGRLEEERRISSLLSGGAAGDSGALAIIAGAGEGKSALLERAAELADSEWRVLRCAGVECQAELPFAGLRQLLDPALHLETVLPEPQRRALCGALGMEQAVEPAERFLIGLATLSLLSEFSAEGPVLCLVDDAQWLDQPTTDALLFTARRLGDEGIVMVFAGRPEFDAPGLPRLQPAPLAPDEAKALLAERVPRLPVEMRDRVIAESAGNPLALLELPGMNLDAPPVGPLDLPERLLSGYRGHIADLPEAARLALLVAAADESNDLGLALRVLVALGSDARALAHAESTGMLGVSGQTVWFRHPLMRAAAYRSATDAQRRAVHTAIAYTLLFDPDRRAWHRAAAATAPEETVAAALESAAERAGERTGHGAAASAWERAAQLTPDRSEQARRLMHAIENAAAAGQYARAGRLATAGRLLGERLIAEGSPLGPERLYCARTCAVLAQIELDNGAPEEAYRLLLDAARLAGPEEPDRAAVLLLDAGRIAWAIGDVDAFRAAHALLADLPPSADRNTYLRIYEAILALFADDPAAGIALLRRNVTMPEHLRHREPAVRFIVATQALVLGDMDLAREILTELEEYCRTRGRLGLLAAVELWLGTVEFVSGRFRAAEILSTEGRRLAENIDQPVRIMHAEANLAMLAAIGGDDERCLRLVRDGLARPGHTLVHRRYFGWALGMLELGRGRYGAALEHLEALDHSAADRHTQWLTAYADRVEAAVRGNEPDRARAALAELRLWSDALGAPWAEALLLRATALLDNDPETYARAMKSHARQDRWFDRARTGLLCGECLRRERRTAEARAELREALTTFERLGARLWADRARAELRAAGAAPEQRSEPAAALSPQELQVVRLAATGATNKEIAARLFLSPKTVGHHLSRAFRKLGVSSRVELPRLELD
ncbi:helix-turn-helix transcriptional regulator [Nocardia crassostreae]|uniref:helix-turn-helix transcriptional regulator n=1 Tax=Nocardia crassostreae TaxID=53428 RepID=UPI00082FE04C|nr:LuxR family transcriptional regulator [Nocardia crassostreae]